MPDPHDAGLAEIADTLADQDSYEHPRLLDPRDGHIVFWSADTGIDGHNPIDLEELEPELIAIHPLPSWTWYQDMADFADELPAGQASDRLTRAIHGKGAFRRFKDELHHRYPGLLPAWHAFRDARARRRAVEWLTDHDLISPQDAENYLTTHGRPNT